MANDVKLKGAVLTFDPGVPRPAPSPPGHIHGYGLMLSFAGTPPAPSDVVHAYGLTMVFDEPTPPPPPPMPQRRAGGGGQILKQSPTPNKMETISGASGNVLSAEIPFANNCTVFEVLVETNPLDLVLVYWDGSESDIRQIPKNAIYRHDGKVRGFKVQNHIPGSNAGYEALGLRSNSGGMAWAERMLMDYLGRNSHANYSDAVKAELLARLQPGLYLQNTFGPTGLDKTVCDFLKLFEFDGDLAIGDNTKTGDVFRWDVDGTVYVQNSSPIHVRNPALPNVITLTTTDGWGGLTRFDLNPNNFCGLLPSFDDCVNMTVFVLENNGFSGSIPSFWNCVSLTHWFVNYNFFSGSLPSLNNIPNLDYVRTDSNNLSGTLPPFANCSVLRRLHITVNDFTTYQREAMQVNRRYCYCYNNQFDQTSIDNFLLDYADIRFSMALSGYDYYIHLGGLGNAAPSAAGLAAKQSIVDAFLATPGSGALTITHN